MTNMAVGLTNQYIQRQTHLDYITELYEELLKNSVNETKKETK